MSLADLLKSSQPTEAEKGNTQPATTGGGSLAQLLKESSPLDRASAVPTKTQELPSAQMVPDVQVPQKEAGGGAFDRYNKAVERKVGAFDAGALEGVSTIVSGFQWLAGQADIASLTSTEKKALDAIQVAQGAGKDTTKLVSSLNAAVQARTGFTDWYGDYAKKTGQIGDAAAKLNEWGTVLKQAGGITPQNQTFLDTLAEGAGSSVVYFAPGMGVARGAELMAAISPRVALLFGNSAMTALESMSEAGNVYQTLKQSGKTDQQASEGATKDFLVNAVLISITNKLGITNPAKLGAIRRALLSAPVEGFQEAAQQLTQNITQGESDPWNGVLESGAIGTILGPFLGGAADVLGGGEAGVAPDIAKKPGAQAPEPALHPSTGATNETVAATIKLAADGPAAVRDEIQTLTLEQQLQPTNTEIAARLGSLQAQLQDYFDVAKETAIHSTEPLLQVDTLKLSGDKYGFSVSAQVDQNSFNIPIQASEVFATKEEAAQAALDAVKAWATTQKQSANATEAQPAYDALIEATKMEGKPQAQTVKNGSTAPVFDEAQQAKIEEHRAYFKLAFEEYNRLADENSDAPFPRLVGDLQEEAVRNLVEAGAIPADIAPFVEKEMAYLGPGAILDENATNFAARLGKKIVGNTGDVSAIPQRIKVAEEQLKDAYRRVGVTQDDQNMLKADEELSYILVEMLELSQAGYRYGDMNAPDGYVAVKSTFPQWVTEDLRSKKLFQAVFGGIGSINELHYPTGSRTKQRRLYQDVLDTLDARLHIDTSEVRGKIMALYEQQTKDNEAAAEKRKAATSGSSRGTAGGEATATQADKVTVTKPRIEAALSEKQAAKTIEAGNTEKTPSGDAMAMYKAEDMPDFPVKMGGFNQTRAVEFPELVDIARELMGKVPEIRKNMGNAAGRFYHVGNDKGRARIALVPDLFKEGNLREAGKVLAHEIGHLVDYLPEGTLKRGNLLGRLHTLNGFMSEVFGSEGKMDTKAIRSQALKDTLNAEGISWGQYMTDKAIRDRLKPLVKTRYNEAITASGGIRNSTVRNELIAVTRYWHPYDPEKVPESYKRYRESSKELYAEAVSMLFNSPGLLEQMAPTFYKQFFAALDEKPQVRDAYFKVQELMSGDREQLTRLRRAGVQKMFTEGDYKAGELNNKQHAEREARARDIRFRLRFELVDKNSRIIDLVSQLENKGVHVNPDDNPVYYLEERNYLGGKIKGVMERDFNPIYQRVQDAGLAWSDLGELMFYQRIVAGDRSEQANPRGITPDAAKELIDAMRTQYGADGFKVLEESANDFRTAVKAIATEAYNEGLYTPELYQQMLDNPAYVTFQVIEHIEDGMSSRVYKSLGTLKDITNPADASLLKVIATLRAIERNKVHAKTIDMLKTHHPSEIQEAKYRWNGKSREPMRPKGRYQELVTVLDKGRVHGYYVDPYIQKSLDNESVGGNNAIIGTIRFFNSTTFRPLFITFNLGFQSFNLIRDFLRFYKNIPGMTLIRALQRYQQGARMSRVRAFGAGRSEADQAEYKKLQKLEHDQILSVTFNDILSGYNEEEKQIERILRESGIDSFKPEEGSKVLKPIKAVLKKIEQVGNMIETLPKAAGYYEFTDQNGGKPISKEQASFIRKNIGSPDFLAGGNIKPATNEIFLFSNAITQGMRSDYNIATDPRTRSGFWWKTTKITFLPKILMAAALAGAFGDAIKRIFGDASEYDMTNYTIVPIGTDANGKSVYMRIPVDESSRFLGGVLWKAMMAVTGQNQQSVGKNIMDIASYTGGQLPSLSPTLEVTSATLQYLGGANPYDAFKGRQVLSDQVYQAGGLESAKAYAGWVFQQLGGGVFVRFYYEPTTPEPSSTAERVVNLPVLGNIIGRFVRITDYGRQEKLKNIQKQTQSEEAQASLRERKLVNKYIGQAQQQGLKLATSSLKADLVKEVLGHAPQTSDEAAHATRIKNKFDLGLKRGNASPEVTALIDADTNKQKVAILQQIHTTMSDSEWTDFKKQLLAQKIVSTTVLYDPSLR